MPFTAYGIHCEDILLLRALNGVSHEQGFYIDVGANDHMQASVTKLFYDRGWHGINIEPSPYWFARLLEYRPRDINLQFAATNQEGTLTFFDHPEGGLGTALEVYADRHEVKYNIAKRRIQVPATTLTSICQKYAPTEIHFLKIDVEGFEKNVLEGIDFGKIRPWILCIEAIEPLRADLPTYQEWEHIPLSAGYDFVQSDDLNRWYLAKEHPERRRAFDFRLDDYLHYNYKRRLEELERCVSEFESSRTSG